MAQVSVNIVGNSSDLRRDLTQSDKALKAFQGSIDTMSSSIARSFDEMARKTDGDLTRMERQTKDHFADMERSMVKAQSTTKGVSAGMAGALGGLGGFIGGFTAMGVGSLVSFGKGAIEEFSSVEEAANRVKVVFGEAGGKITEFAETASNIGLSKKAALEAAGGFGALFVPMGIANDQASDMSLSLTKLSADMASFSNTSIEDAMVALKAGLVGESEPLRRFGVMLNEARIKAEAFRMGIARGDVDMAQVNARTIAVEKAQKAYNDAVAKHGVSSLEARAAMADIATKQQAVEDSMAGSNVQLDAQQKAMATYSLIMKDTSLQQGDFARTSESWANQTRINAAEFDNLKAAIGERLMPVAMTVMTWVREKLDAISAWWDDPNGGQAMLAKFQDGWQKVKTFWEQNIQPIWDGLSRTFDNLFGATWDERRDNFLNGWDMIKDKIQTVWDKLQTVADKIREITGLNADNAGGSFRAGSDMVQGGQGWLGGMSPASFLYNATGPGALNALWGLANGDDPSKLAGGGAAPSMPGPGAGAGAATVNNKATTFNVGNINASGGIDADKFVRDMRRREMALV